MAEVHSWIDRGESGLMPPVEVVAASDYRDALAQIERLRAALEAAHHWLYADDGSRIADEQTVLRVREALGSAAVETPARCPVTWQPVIGGPAVPCTLPVGHNGKHLAPEPFAAETPARQVPRRGWMIEKVGSSPPQWWKGTECNLLLDEAWTTDPNNTAVFASDTSALVVQMALARNTWRYPERTKAVEKLTVSEHEWPAVETAAQPIFCAWCAARLSNESHQHWCSTQKATGEQT